MMRTTLFLSFMLVVTPAAGANLLRNGDFAVDADKDGAADGWAKNVHKGAQGTYSIERDKAGRFCQRVDHTNDSKEWVRVNQDNLRARKNAVYVASVEVKASGPWSVLLYQFRSKPKHANDYDTHYIGTGGATGWKRISKAVHTTADATQFRMSLITQGKGTAWFRNASLIHLGDRPMTLVPRAAKAPKLDGRLDGPAWKRAASLSELFLLDGKGKRSEVSTTVRVFTAGEVLYVGFDCAEPQRAKQRIDDETGKAPSWGEDTVEVFLQPEGSGRYYHIGVTPTGGVLTEVKGSGGRNYWATWYDRLRPETRDFSARAAVQRDRDRWTVELAVPFDALGGRPRPGKVWRGNFVRSRKLQALEQNSSWAYIEGATFHRTDRFGELIFAAAPASPPITVPAKDLLDATPLTRPTIVPQPRTIEWLADKPIPLTGKWRVVGPDGPAQALVDSLARQTGLQLRQGEAPGSGPAVRLIVKKPAGREAYSLRTDAQGAMLVAGDDRSLMHAVATWVQLVTMRGRQALLWPARIDDEPDMVWRGWHLIGPAHRDALPECRRLIGIMAGLKYNVVCIQIDNRLKYTRRPELSSGPDAPTKQQVRDLVAYAEGLGMTVIPMTQCWSHFNYFLTKKKFKHLTAHPQPGKGGRGDYWNYCPRHPEVHPLLFDMIEEQLECFPNARYFHVGLDEISFGPIGQHPLTKDSPPHVIFAEEVRRLHDFVAGKKGLKTCMWGDQLLREHNGGAPHHTAKAVDMIPKDIIIFDWHYGASRAFPSVAFFKRHGFQVVASGWYEPINVYYLSETAHEQQVLGYSGTTWWAMDRIHSQTRLRNAIPLAAENAWSSGRPTLDQITYRPGEVFGRLWPARPYRSIKEFVLMDLSSHCNERLDDREGRRWLTADREHTLVTVPTGRQVWGGVPFNIGRPGGKGANCVVLADDSERSRYPKAAWQIPLGARVDAIALLHTLSQPRKFTEHIYDRARANPTHLGRYVIHYADGQRRDVQLEWEVNVCHWNHRLGAAHGRTAYLGKTKAGALIRLEYYVWENPRPNVAIRAIDLVSGKDQARPVLLAITGIRYQGDTSKRRGVGTSKP